MEALALLCWCLLWATSAIAASQPAFTNTFSQQFQPIWSPSQIWASDVSNSVQISLTQTSGSGFSSYNSFLFGKFEAKIKTVPGNSAGTCFSYYMSSNNQKHDEIDFEFLGNETGQPVILQTNLYAGGVGGREMRTFLWFDPSADYHTYTILWNRYQIVWLVDNIPVRVFKDATHLGVPFPNANPQMLSSSIYDAGDWATRGGLDKIYWAAAPFVGSYRYIQTDGCQWSNHYPACATQAGGSWWDQPRYRSLTAAQIGQLHWVQNNYGVYDYCTDRTRYPVANPECSLRP